MAPGEAAASTTRLCALVVPNQEREPSTHYPATPPLLGKVSDPHSTEPLRWGCLGCISPPWNAADAGCFLLLPPSPQLFLPIFLHACHRQPFFDRLKAHVQRANASLGCTCGRCGSPALVAFSGKRQFEELFGGGEGRSGSNHLPRSSKRQRRGCAYVSTNMASAAAAAAGEPSASTSAAGDLSLDLGSGAVAEQSQRGGDEAWLQVSLQSQRPASIQLGRQWVLPAGWPLDVQASEVWVMTSTSGAAALSREARLAPWRELAGRLARHAWPRGAAACGGGED